MAPLLFVCDSKPVRPRAKLARASLATIDTPEGPAFMAFADHELAGDIVALCGTAPGVFLLPETRFIPELVQSLTTHPVLVFKTYDDYVSAMSRAPTFQWAEHMVDYDFVAALAAAKPIRQDPTAP
jgi:hypothetical protein